MSDCGTLSIEVGRLLNVLLSYLSSSKVVLRSQGTLQIQSGFIFAYRWNQSVFLSVATDHFFVIIDSVNRY